MQNRVRMAVVSISASHVVGRGFAWGHAKDNHKLYKLLPSLACRR